MTSIDELKRAIAAVPERSLAAKLRLLMPEIELRVQAGASYEAIVQTLQQHGLPVSVNTFRNYLYRWRKDRAQAAAGLVEPVAIPPQVTSESAASTGGKPKPQIQNKGDLVRLRKETEFDLDELAKAAKGQKE